MKRIIFVVGVALWFSTKPALAVESLQDRLAKAKTGDVVELPAGEFQGGAVLPAGVSIKGAGYDKTTINAKGLEYGLVANDGAKITDLTIQGASKANLKIDHAQNTRVSRVRTTDGTLGVLCMDATDVRVENVLADGNLCGIVLNDSKNCSVVNCTIALNRMLGLNLASGEKIVAFNNVLANNEVGVYVGTNLKDSQLDHNLYCGSVVGRLAGQIRRLHIGSWQLLSGLDQHSLHLNTEFLNPDKGDFHAASRLAWCLDRATTSDWGVPQLGGVSAPQTDMDNAPRTGGLDVGAFEASPVATRPADGSFTVNAEAHAVSAGVFDKQGKLVCYLFQNLPLAKGSYHFHLPSRDFQGNPIPAGDYEVYVAQGNLDWTYLNKIGDNTPTEKVASQAAPAHADKIAFGPDGQLFVATGWSEDTTNVRSYDATTGKLRWIFAGQKNIDGMTVSPQDEIYLLKREVGGKTASLSRLDAKNGKPIAWADGKIRQVDLDVPAGRGLAYWNGKLYAGYSELPDAKADPKAEPVAAALRFGDASVPKLDHVVKLNNPTSLSVDLKTNVLWLIGDQKTLAAFDSEGQSIAATWPVEKPLALCARDGVLAVASGKTGKVHLFDASDVKNLKEIKTIGRGDGPFGPWTVDRFQFQEGRDAEDAVKPDLAIGPNGELAVADGSRCLVFDKDGKYLWHTYGVYGGDPSFGFADPKRFWEAGGVASYRLDETKGTWEVEGYWKTARGHTPVIPLLFGLGMQGDFRVGADTFTVFRSATKGGGAIVICKAEQFVHRPVVGYFYDRDKKTGVRIIDSDRDGELTTADQWTPMSDSKQGPGSDDFWQMRSANVCENGDLLTATVGKASVWKFQGLDSNGVPQYTFDATTFAQPKDLKNSPYTYAPPKGPADWWDIERDSPGKTMFVALRGFDSKCDSGLAFSTGQDLMGLDLAGGLRWHLPLYDYNGFYAAECVDGVMILGGYQSHDYLAVSKDGLILGTAGPTKASQYTGYWLDHVESIRSYRGADGQQYMLVMDNYSGSTHWWRITGHDRTTTHREPLKVSAELARALAQQPASPLAEQIAHVSKKRTVKIPKLAQPLTIDGDSKKWRDLNIAPQIVIPPSGDPRNCSGLVRVAWEGKNLYFQVLQFDNEIAFGGIYHYLQDAFESCINGAFQGMKLDATMVDGKSTLLRQKFYTKEGNFNLDPQHAPRVIKTLDNAQQVVERELLEAIFGVDMSQCKVIVYEYKLPIDEVTYQGLLADLFPLQVGTKFWFGCAIDDCDVWGSNSSAPINAPTTYTPFNPKEAGLEMELDD